MLFFDAYTLEGNFRVFIIEKECFFMTQKQKTHRIAVAALLAAVAAVLQFVEFSIPIMPAFVKLDISDLPALLGTFSLGPVYGVQWRSWPAPDGSHVDQIENLMQQLRTNPDSAA